MHTIAITRAVPASIEACELTHLERSAIDVERARRQHIEYQRALTELGCVVIELPEEPELPDSVFVEDTAVVFDECAVIMRPGAESRRAETASVRAALSTYRTLNQIEPPGTVDGGDVLRIGRRVFVGQSTRTNEEGIRQLSALLRPFDYEVIGVNVQGCLHLKSAATVVADNMIVVDSSAFDPQIFGAPYLDVPAKAANLLLVNGIVLCPAVAAPTAERLEKEGLRVQLIDNSELAKAEAGLTCCSILLSA